VPSGLPALLRPEFERERDIVLREAGAATTATSTSVLIAK
jgi:hypothetical protein